MKNLKVLAVLSGLLIGVGAQAEKCSLDQIKYSPAVTMQNSSGKALYVNIGDNAAPNKEGAGNLWTGYKAIGVDGQECFRTGLRGGKIWVRESTQLVEDAIPFDTKVSGAMNAVAHVYKIEILPGGLKGKLAQKIQSGLGSAGVKSNIGSMVSDKAIKLYGFYKADCDYRNINVIDMARGKLDPQTSKVRRQVVTVQSDNTVKPAFSYQESPKAYFTRLQEEADQRKRQAELEAIKARPTRQR
jgi:hypothetical protein